MNVEHDGNILKCFVLFCLYSTSGFSFNVHVSTCLLWENKRKAACALDLKMRLKI